MLRLPGFAFMMCAAALAAAAERPAVPDPAIARAKAALAQLPLRFESNQGQTNPAVRYTARAGGYSLFLTTAGPSVSFGGSQVDISLMRSNRSPELEPLDRLSTRIDYFVGNRKNWRADVPSYQRVRYRAVYPGIDVVYYGNQNQLEYDFVLAPGADPNAIRMQFSGARQVKVSPEGDLVVESGTGRMVQKKPFIYQQDPGSANRRQVAGHYMMLAHNVVGFRLDRYDRTQPVVIDPVLIYGTYFGGNGSDQVNAVKIGPNNRLYLAIATDTNIIAPVDAGYSNTAQGLGDIFLAVVDTTPGGNYPLTYGTYIGGAQFDAPLALDVDSAGIAYITGTTNSTDFPVVGNPIQSTGASTASDAFIAKVDPSQSGTAALLFSSYLGGTTGAENGVGISLGPNGQAYVIGSTTSSDFPVTASAYASVIWGPQDVFICQIDTNAGALAYSTYIGGESSDFARSIAVDSKGLVYFGGSTLSQTFPAAGFINYPRGPFGAEDIFVGVLDTTVSGPAGLRYSTYLGGSGNDELRSMALDAKGNLMLTGYTLSTDFPISNDAMQGKNNGNADAFVSVLNFADTTKPFLVYSTYLGGAHGDVGYAVQGDAAGEILVTGYTLSSDFPVTGNAQQFTWPNGTDIFLTVFKPGITGPGALQYSTFIGATGTYVGTGLQVGSDGTAYITGYGGDGLPMTANSYQNGYGGGPADAFLLVVTQAATPGTGLTGQPPGVPATPQMGHPADGIKTSVRSETQHRK